MEVLKIDNNLMLLLVFVDNNEASLQFKCVMFISPYKSVFAADVLLYSKYFMVERFCSGNPALKPTTPKTNIFGLQTVTNSCKTDI